MPRDSYFYGHVIYPNPSAATFYVYNLTLFSASTAGIGNALSLPKCFGMSDGTSSTSLAPSAPVFIPEIIKYHF